MAQDLINILDLLISSVSTYVTIFNPHNVPMSYEETETLRD